MGGAVVGAVGVPFGAGVGLVLTVPLAPLRSRGAYGGPYRHVIRRLTFLTKRTIPPVVLFFVFILLSSVGVAGVGPLEQVAV